MWKKTDHSSPYVTFQMRKLHEATRRSHALRQEAHTDRVRMWEIVIHANRQAALKGELAMIHGYQSRMMLPPIYSEG